MSVTKTEAVFCDTSESQWVQDSSPNVPQTVMDSDLYELSPLNQPPNVSPPAYQPPNGLGVNGANGVNYIPNNINGSYDRSAANLPNGIMHGMRTLNIPNGLNGNPMLRPNGMNMVANVNGYVNAGNQRFLVRPPGWLTSAKPSSGVKKQKRNRTAFTSQQMMELEQEYARTRYLDRTRRIELSEILHLNERTIKIWFQNRRMKEKKDRAESLEDSEEVSTTGSSPELGMSGNVPMPMLLPTTVTNEAYGRGMYVDYQHVPSQMVPMPPLMPNPMGDYPGYVPAEDYEAQCRLGQIQMQQYPPMYNELQEVPAEPSTSQPEGTPVTASASEQNWDLSWIRSMQVDDEF